MTSNNNSCLKSGEKISAMLEIFDLSAESVEYAERFNEQTEHVLSQLLARAILYPTTACISWAQFIKTATHIYKDQKKLDLEIPEQLKEQLKQEPDNIYWKMLSQQKTIAEKLRFIQIIKVNAAMERSKSNNALTKVQILNNIENELINLRKKRKEILKESRLELGIGLSKSIVLTISMAFKLGAQFAISAALPWVLTSLYLIDTGVTVHKAYLIHEQYKLKNNEIKSLQLEIKNLNASMATVERVNRIEDLEKKIISLRCDVKKLKTSRKKAFFEAGAEAIMITATVALLANPVTAVAASAIAITAFTCTAILGLFKGGCFMQKVKENVVQQQNAQQIDQQANQTQSSEVSDSASNSGDQTADSSSSDIKPESQTSETSKASESVSKAIKTSEEIIEDRMGHTDLLFEKIEEEAQLDSSKAAGSEQGEDEGEGEGESPH